jgi:tetratricopeptide (TPR) repeat protein
MNKPSMRALCAAWLIALATAGAVHAVGEGRLQGTVVDEKTGKPIQGVKVTITSTEFQFKQERTTDAKGKFSMMFVDSTADYKAHFEKAGYAILEQPVELMLGGVKQTTFSLPPAPTGGQGQAPGAEGEPGQPQELSGTNKAILAYNEGVNAMNAKDLATALAKFEEARTLDPQLAAVADGYIAVASNGLDQQQYPTALKAVDRYLEIKPGDAAGLRMRYDLLKATGDTEKSSAALDLLAKTDPGRDTAVRYFNLAAEAVRNGKTDQAVPLLQKSLEIDPTLDQAYSALAGIYLPKKSYKEALALGDKLQQLKPDSVEAMTIRYQAYQGLGDKAKVKEVKAAMDGANSNQTPESAFSQGVTLYNANNVKEAIQAFERAVAAKPDYAKAHYMLGLSYVASNDMAKAKQHLQEFIRMAPSDPDAAAAKEMLGTLE